MKNRQVSKAAVAAENVFREKYGREPAGCAFTPYRICPLGAHVDHNLGKITGFAVNKGIYMVYAPTTDGSMEVTSLQFPGQVRWPMQAVPDTKQGDWADHLRGAVLALQKRYPVPVGIRAVVNGELPVGGLSSSAAVILTCLSALCRVNALVLTPQEMITMAREAENRYVGVACGKLDQSCEVYCRKDHLLYMDTKDDSYALLPAPAHMKPYVIMILFSGVERSLAGTAYNMRVDEAQCAAYALLAYAGLPYGKLADTYLRDVPAEIYEQYKNRLPDPWRRRAEHWFTENARVEAGVEAWRRGDIETFGKLCFASGKSSVENWQTGSPELLRLYELMTETDGIYGGRFSGAGIKGCCMALADPAFAEHISQTITQKYTAEFPERKEKFSVHICRSADGICAENAPA